MIDDIIGIVAKDLDNLAMCIIYSSSKAAAWRTRSEHDIGDDLSNKRVPENKLREKNMDVTPVLRFNI